MKTKIDGHKLLRSIKRHCRACAKRYGWTSEYAAYAVHWMWLGARRAVWDKCRKREVIRNPQRFAECAARRALRRDATGRVVIPYWPVLADGTGMPKNNCRRHTAP